MPVKNTRENYAEWYAENKDRLSKEDREAYRLRKERDPEALFLRGRRATLAAYGLSLEQYDDLWNAQKGLCGICKQPEPPNRKLDIDHTCCPGKKSCGACIRGLLCLNCNTKLSFVEKFEREIILWRSKKFVGSVAT